ncbi:4-hydroxythreonine-4-phosphate dehydrogenase PdxA [bacterium]|nr:4-hydroxythreonine-4-phosphate dehydrogenase PdxA [bacterium]
MSDTLPRIAITMGDPAGIGPEVIVKALPEALSFCRPILVADPQVMRRAVARFSPDNVQLFAEKAPLVAPPGASAASPVVFNANPEIRGAIQRACVEKAVSLAMAGEAEAIVTAPASKEAFAAAGTHAGHTELLAELTNTHPPVMMLTGPSLSVVPLTIHVALADVPHLLTRELIEVQAIIVDRELRARFGIAKPRLALAALNPHAGEGGLFGREDDDILAPAVAALRARGIDITGPHSADTVFVKAVRGAFDVVLAPTHDQALIPLKLLHFDEGVNITLGLPIIRTSPDHGTAPDIAWKGEANPASMVAAMRMAAQIAETERLKD